MNLYFQQRASLRHNGEVFAGESRLFTEPRCQTFADVAVIVGAAAAAAGAGYSIYSQSNAPSPPNLASSSAQAAGAQANALPIQRALSAAAQEGTDVNAFIPGHTEMQQFVKYKVGTNSLMDRVVAGDKTAIGPQMLNVGTMNVAGALGFGDKDRYTMIPYNAADWQPGGKYYDPSRPNYGTNNLVTRPVKVKPGNKNFDFTGFGTADVQGKLANQMAEIEKNLGDKYGTQFAEQARKELEQSDPQGAAARDAEYNLIQKAINTNPDRPVADLLDKQVGQQLLAGNHLDPMERDILDQAVADAQSARGQSGTSNDAFASPMETGAAGEARRQAGIQKGLAWESSGATPEDVAYRRSEQNLSDLGSFINGQGPVTQFKNLSGAQQGAAPFVPGGPQPTMSNPNVAAAGGFALGNWDTQMRQLQNTASPWMAGLTAMLKGANAVSLVQPGAA